MAKRKQIVNKTLTKKLSKSWIGVVVLILLLGYQWFSDNQPIAPGERYEVTYLDSVDGDTAWFRVDGEKVKVRFLYIDTPESTTKVEPYGKEAAQYVENRLKKASKIELETNVDGGTYDKYDRLLAWVFVDGELLQVAIARQGYVKKYYDYDYEYTYKNEIIEANERAKMDKVGIYQ